jgi:4-hydroxy-tetrahydrodipicolinate reductase
VNLLLIGHGRMGRLVWEHAASHGCEVVAIADIDAPIASVLKGALDVDVAIDFSQAEAVEANLRELIERRINVVIGTTGWQDREPDLRRLAVSAGIGVLASANFSLGVHVFTLIVEQAARRFGGLDGIGAFIHETHHAAKRDAPSGTALQLQRAMASAGYGRPIDMASTRVGYVPGTHVVGFDGPADTVTLTHTVRDRAVFAHGALEAARWLKGRRGWFSMRDMIES